MRAAPSSPRSPNSDQPPSSSRRLRGTFVASRATAPCEASELRARELERANDELRRTSQLKSQLLAMASHDLRAPLASMIALAEMLFESCDPAVTPEVRQRLSTIVDVGHRMSTLVTDLLDLDRCERGALSLTPRWISARALVRAAAGAAHEPARVRVIEPEGQAAGLAWMIGDPHRLEQVLANLLGNALKFSPEGAVVEIGCGPTEAGMMGFWVEDRGPGIPEGALDAIFDPYVQLDATPSGRPRGLGLGLAIVRRFVELHGGQAGARNREDGGARFEIELPISGPVAFPRVDAALLVGPASDDFDRIARALAAAGLHALRAERVPEALRRLSIERPALVVADARAIDAQVSAALRAAAANGARIARVSVDDEPLEPAATGEEAPDEVSLVTPVMELEITALLRSLGARDAS
jgi:signal transduction histidine kinase